MGAIYAEGVHHIVVPCSLGLGWICLYKNEARLINTIQPKFSVYEHIWFELSIFYCHKGLNVSPPRSITLEPRRSLREISPTLELVMLLYTMRKINMGYLRGYLLIQ